MNSFFLSALFDQHGDGDDSDDEPHEDDGVTCDRCGEGGLTWVNTGLSRWRLVDDSGFHICKAHVKDFDNLPQ